MDKIERNSKLLVENIAKLKADMEAKEQKILKSKIAPAILRAVQRKLLVEDMIGMEAKSRSDLHTLLIDERLKLVAQKFENGRKPGTAGPIRKRIRSLLKKQPDISNADLWASISQKPPAGYTACDNPQGKYLEAGARTKGGDLRNMKYARFCNICSEERKSLTG